MSRSSPLFPCTCREQRRYILLGFFPAVLQPHLGVDGLGEDDYPGGIAVQPVDYEDAVAGLGVALPDISGQHGVESPGFVPLRAHCQKPGRLDRHQDVVVFVEYADIPGKVPVAGP